MLSATREGLHGKKRPPRSHSPSQIADPRFLPADRRLAWSSLDLWCPLPFLPTCTVHTPAAPPKSCEGHNFIGCGARLEAMNGKVELDSTGTLKASLVVHLWRHRSISYLQRSAARNTTLPSALFGSCVRALTSCTFLDKLDRHVLWNNCALNSAGPASGSLV
jgi:hypothetical protein